MDMGPNDGIFNFLLHIRRAADDAAFSSRDGTVGSATNVDIVAGTEAAADDTNASGDSGANTETATDIATGITINRCTVITGHGIDEMATNGPEPPRGHDGELPTNADTAASRMPDAPSNPTKRRKRANPGHSLRKKTPPGD